MAKPKTGSLSAAKHHREKEVVREHTQVVYKSGDLNELAQSREDMDEPGERVMNSGVHSDTLDDNNVVEGESEIWGDPQNVETPRPNSKNELPLTDPEINVSDDLNSDLEELRHVSTPGVLSVLPKSVKFESQSTGEQVILILRRHPITNFRWIATAILLSLVPLVVTMVDAFAPNFPARYVIMGAVVWELVVIGFVFEEFLRWFFNIYIITNRRIVDIDFYHLLYLEMSETDLSKIQDVSVANKGIMSSVFNFGDIHIQTAAEKSLFEFISVKEADTVASVIRTLSQNRNEQEGGNE